MGLQNFKANLINISSAVLNSHTLLSLLTSLYCTFQEDANLQEQNQSNKLDLGSYFRVSVNDTQPNPMLFEFITCLYASDAANT